MFCNHASLGIGLVSNISISAGCIRWMEPVFKSSDVTALSYNVSVNKDGLSDLIATTNETEYCPELTPCQEYTVTVTPFSTSPDYVGTYTTITNTIAGGNDSTSYHTLH